MKNLIKLATAFVAGAAVMFYLDPLTGRRRRALARDRGVAATHDLGRFARAKSKRAADRMRGVLAETRSRISAAPIDDEQLHDRIRARLGHLTHRAGSVEVDVHRGHVVLKGHLPPAEVDGLVDAITAMRGVESVDNRLLTGGEGIAKELPAQEARH